MAGSIITFSSGNKEQEYLKFRKLPVKNMHEAKAGVIERLTDTKNAIFVNAYPMPFLPLAGLDVIETVMHPVTFKKAMRYCRHFGLSPVLLAQPFYAHACIRLLETMNIRLSGMTLIMGGYACPWSLERKLSNSLRAVTGAANIYHAYGLAEHEAAMLIGRRQINGEVIYQNISETYQVFEGENGNLFLKSGSQTTDTGDRVAEAAGGFCFDPVKRCGVRQWSAWESWIDPLWSRRTGYTALYQDELIAQTFPDVTPGPNEMEFYEFIRHTGFTYHSKPEGNVTINGDNDKSIAELFGENVK